MKHRKSFGFNQMLELGSVAKWFICFFYISVTSSVLSQEIDSYPVNLYWGDTHVHTYLSSDAFATGTTITSDQAYRFAKGERIKANGGQYASIRTPLDFIMIADHAEDLGAFAALSSTKSIIEDQKVAEQLLDQLKKLPKPSELVNAENKNKFKSLQNELIQSKGLKQTKFNLSQEFKRDIWSEVINEAERHYQPGKFTTFVGYEYSATEGGMAHRNVMFSGSPKQTGSIIPFSALESQDPEDLWKFLTKYKEESGDDVITIPHNTNLSNGQFFKNETFKNTPFSYDYLQVRTEFEPIIEVTQFKGDSETHPLISPDDSYANFERGWFDTLNRARDDSLGVKIDKAERSHARSVLKKGLTIKKEFGVNPFKFGVIGSTDTHTGLSTAEEDNFWGKMAYEEPSQYRAMGMTMNMGASGLAAVWATDNTRESIFSSIRRKEVYATTGTRISLRFFGGWSFTKTDIDKANFSEIGYQKGVPMGGDLYRISEKRPPSFLVVASKDPMEANLDRIQVIKGWQDESGLLHEKVYDLVVAPRANKCSNKIKDNCSLAAYTAGSYSDQDGSETLQAFWQDPEFNENEYSFYYVRVLQVPTPRWNTYDYATYGEGELKPQTIQERAYSSPIWYRP